MPRFQTGSSCCTPCRPDCERKLRRGAQHPAVARVEQDARRQVGDRATRIAILRTGRVDLVAPRIAEVRLEDRVPARADLVLVGEVQECRAAIAIAEIVPSRRAVLCRSEQRRSAVELVETREPHEPVGGPGARLDMLVEPFAFAGAVVHAPVGLDAGDGENAGPDADVAVEVRGPEPRLRGDLGIREAARMFAFGFAVLDLDEVALRVRARARRR